MLEPTDAAVGTLLTVLSHELTELEVHRFMQLGYVHWRGACWLVTNHHPRYAGGGRYAHEFKLTRVMDDNCA